MARKLENYLDEKKRLKAWPGKQKVRLLVLEYLAGYFTCGVEYTEKEVNEILNEIHTFQDPALLRRELYDWKFLHRSRDCRRYWKAEPKEGEGV